MFILEPANASNEDKDNKLSSIFCMKLNANSYFIRTTVDTIICQHYYKPTGYLYTQDLLEDAGHG